MFIRSGLDEESAETPQVSERSQIANENENSQRLVDQDFTDLLSYSFAERTCSLRQSSVGSYRACLPKEEDIWSAKFILCGCRPRTLGVTLVPFTRKWLFSSVRSFAKTSAYFGFCVDVTAHLRRERLGMWPESWNLGFRSRRRWVSRNARKESL